MPTNPLIIKMDHMLAKAENGQRGFVVAALYKFVFIDDIATLRRQLQSLCERNTISGTLLLADEGINGTIAATRTGILAFLDWLGSDRRFDGL